MIFVCVCVIFYLSEVNEGIKNYLNENWERNIFSSCFKSKSEITRLIMSSETFIREVFTRNDECNEIELSEKKKWREGTLNFWV